MNRATLTTPMRTALLARLLESLEHDCAKLDRQYPAGSQRALLGARDAAELILVTDTLLKLTGAVFGDEAEVRVGALLKWDAGDGKGRFPFGQALLAMTERDLIARTGRAPL